MLVQLDQLYLFHQRALAWIDAHLESFSPLTGGRAGCSVTIYQTKALGELALLCMLSSRATRDGPEPTIELFLRFIHTIWQHPQFQERIYRQPAYFYLHLMLYVVLRQYHLIDASTQEMIQCVIDQGYVTAVETTPMRLLDRRHMLDAGQFQHTLPSYEQLYAQTLLAQTPPPFYYSDTDAYAITHTLFYLTDFGARSTPALAGEHLANVHWTIETLLGLYLYRQHWDLVGELLLDCYCLHWYPDVLVPIAWETVWNAQLPDGSIPGPRFSEAKLEQLESEQRKQYCFEQNYHTTLVQAITSFLIYHHLKDDAQHKQEQ